MEAPISSFDPTIPVQPSMLDAASPNPTAQGSPRTAAASRARLKHGLYSQQAVIPGEDPRELEMLRREMWE